MTPRLPRFKMSEVDLDSELQMERVRHLYHVIEDHVLAQVSVAVNCAELTQLVPTMHVPQFLSNPYHLAHKALVNLTAQIQRDAGLHDKVDFIFDRRSEELKIQRAFDHYWATLPPDFAEVTGNPPIFRDEEEFLPLQAADLLAWWTRRLWLADGKISERGVVYPWEKRKSLPMLVLDLAGDDLLGELRMIESYMQRKAPSVTITVTFHADLAPKTEDDDGSAS
jgi:hypothetical protein